MIAGIGVDIASISRFQGFLDKGNNSLIKRLFTDKEISCCSSRKDAASCFAARFAAKEAFLKALGTGLRDGISWHDIEIINDVIGKPELAICAKAKEIADTLAVTKSFLSISHDAGSAVAMVVLER